MSDDLIQRLRDECHCNDWYLRKAAATALEAKDAEIERLKSGWHDCISDLTAAQKRAEQAERALAEAVEVLRPFAEIREALELISANKPGDVLQDERAIEEGGVNGIFLERHRGHVVPGRILLTM